MADSEEDQHQQELQEPVVDEPQAEGRSTSPEEPEPQQGNNLSEDELSELDEDQFQDVDVEGIGKPIDEQVFKIKAHRRKTAKGDRSSMTANKEKKRPRKPKGEDGSLDASRRAREPNVMDNQEEEIDPETARRRELERRIDAALKPIKKRKKLGEDDIEQMQDERISRLREDMRRAAIDDAESIREGKPATHKLGLLPDVQDVLQKQTLYDSILDNNLLDAIRMWLEPLPDASLPAYSIQKAIFDALVKMPIKTIHLRESGLGRVVLFYKKSNKPHLQIKRQADRLVAEWSRPIMGRSDNYKDKVVASAVYTPGQQRAALSSRQNYASQSTTGAGKSRASIPTATPVTFQVAPRSQVPSGNGGISGESHEQQDDQYKRIRQRMLNAGRAKAKKSGVSIEGKGLM